jgi:serine/threonine-protein kinase RsbT
MRAPYVMEVAAEDDRWWASAEAGRFAASLGFSPQEQARVALCVAELASNAAKHAGRGRIELSEITTPAHGCRVLAEDEGPGIAAFAEALRDGFSEGRFLTPDIPLAERRGLGVGLGAICRAMSEVRMSSRVGGGLSIEAVLWRKAGPVGSKCGGEACPRT